MAKSGRRSVGRAAAAVAAAGLLLGLLVVPAAGQPLPQSAPGASDNPIAVAGNASVTVSWTAVASDDPAGLRYTVRSYRDFNNYPEATVCDTAALSCVVTAVIPDHYYSFDVQARDSFGAGLPSYRSSSVKAVAPPTAPTVVLAEVPYGEPGAVRVTWGGESDGGVTPVSYKVTASPGGAVCTSLYARECLFTGLPVGQSYTFTVRATNAVGTSPASPPSAPIRVDLVELAPWASRAGYGDVLAVEANVDGGTGSGLGVFTFVIQKQGAADSWAALPGTRRTDGDGQARVTLPPGVYRVVFQAKPGFAAATSASVKITKPRVRARASVTGYGDKLRIDVDPNRGSGFWQVKVQRRVAGRWRPVTGWLPTRRTAEVRTVTLPRGTYRAVVDRKYGFLGTKTDPVAVPGKTVKVRVGVDARRLWVDIDPDVGQFTFQLARNGVTLGQVYRTDTSGKALTPLLLSGTYAVIVDAAHGYRGGTFGTITIR